MHCLTCSFTWHLMLNDLVVYLVERWKLSIFGSKILETLLVEKRFTCFMFLKPDMSNFWSYFFSAVVSPWLFENVSNVTFTGKSDWLAVSQYSLARSFNLIWQRFKCHCLYSWQTWGRIYWVGEHTVIFNSDYVRNLPCYYHLIEVACYWSRYMNKSAFICLPCTF